MNAPNKGASPPWINPQMQHGVVARDGDIWISVPVKSGTNWMMNIVHQLRTGGDTSFASIYDVVPWPEFVERPGQPQHEVIDRIEAMPTSTPRAFKTHSAPPDMPFVKVGQGKDVKYIAVCRNPEEALVSLKLFLEAHTDAFYDLWKLPKAVLTRPDFATFYREVVDAAGLQATLFGFLMSWWPLRHEANVLLLHYADIQHDSAKVLRRIASFLGASPTAAQWDAIEKHASFAWMKANESKFENHPLVSVPLLTPGAMIRKGKAGAAHEDGMTAEIAAHLRDFGGRFVSDPVAMRWFYEGGPLPAR